MLDPFSVIITGYTRSTVKTR